MPLSSILWGPTYENTLSFGYSLYDRLTDREERPGSDHQIGVSGTEDSWITGRDFTLMAAAKFVPESHVQGVLGGSTTILGGGAARTGWSSAVGYQDFLDYHRQGLPFRFAPDATLPGFYLDGCYLVDPKSPGPGSVGDDLNRVVSLKIRNPLYDFSRALRGILWEYAPGKDVTQPVAATVLRNTIGMRYAVDGSVAFDAINVLRDRHYANGLGSVRSTLVEPIAFTTPQGQFTNWLLQSQAFNTGTWSLNQITAVDNTTDTKAPDGTQTATKLVPSVTSTNLHEPTQPITITSGEFVALSVHARAGAYSGLVFRFADGGSTHEIQMVVDLTTGAILSTNASAGATVNAKVVPLANGWYRLLLWGIIAGGVTSATPFLQVYDTGAHANSATAYAGDGTSGIYVWGAQAERNGTANDLPPSSYVATTSAAVLRGADTFTTVLPVANILPTWLYARFVDRQETQRGSGIPRVLAISAGGSNPRLMLYATGGKYACAFLSAGGVQTTAAAVALPNYGDVVELLGWYDAAGNVNLVQAVNGVPAAVVTAASGVTPVGAWGIPSVGIGSDGGGVVVSQTNLLNAKVGIQGLGGRTVQDVATALAA